MKYINNYIIKKQNKSSGNFNFKYHTPIYSHFFSGQYDQYYFLFL